MNKGAVLQPHCEFILGNARIGNRSLAFFEFPDVQTSWVLRHDLGLDVIVRIYGPDGAEVIPNTLQLHVGYVDVGFLGPQDGTAVVIRAIDSDVRSYIHTQVGANVSWTIPHSFGQQFVDVVVYDNTNTHVLPNTIRLVDANTMQLLFLVATAGKAIVF